LVQIKTIEVDMRNCSFFFCWRD